MIRSLMVFAKLALAGGLIYWLFATDRLDLHDLSLYTRVPLIAGLSLVFWLCGSIVASSLRWRSLVLAQGLRLSVLEGMRLSLIGVFFNTIMPGAVSGDLLKGLYLSRLNSGREKAPIFLSLFLDRLLGLMALFMFSILGVVTHGGPVMHHPVLAPLIKAVVVVAALGVTALLIFFKTPQGWRAPLASFFATLQRRLPKPLASIFATLVAAMTLYRDQPSALGKAFLFACIHQSLFVGLFLTVTTVMIGGTGDLPYGLLFMILPLGIATTALPIAPSGLGVGHLAFEKLFQLIGLSEGANVFNLITLGQIALNLLGAIPYVLYRAELKSVVEEAKQASPATRL